MDWMCMDLQPVAVGLHQLSARAFMTFTTASKVNMSVFDGSGFCFKVKLLYYDMTLLSSDMTVSHAVVHCKDQSGLELNGSSSYLLADATHMYGWHTSNSANSS